MHAHIMYNSYVPYIVDLNNYFWLFKTKFLYLALKLAQKIMYVAQAGQDL